MAIIKVKTGGITADAITDALIADDVVGTEHLTANEVDTTALGADAVTGAQLADDAVNSEHYTDGSVDTAHIADAQITTAKLSTAVFTGATDIGADLADADLILVDDGAGGTIRKAALSRIKTYAGGGKINQVLHTDAQVNQNVSSDTELMSLAITPSASNSKIYMLFNGTVQLGGNEYASFDFYRGSLSSGTKVLDGGETVFNGYDNIRFGFSMSFLDSPNTTSAVTYTVVGVPLASSTVQFGATARNTLTLMEVLA